MSAKRLSSVVAFCLMLATVLSPANPAPAQVIASPEADSTGPAESATALHALYGQLPLLFIENRGQTDPRVAFTLQAGAATVYFTPTGVTYALVEPGQDDDQMTPNRRILAGLDAAPPRRGVGRRWAVKLDFVGANPDVRPVGQEQAETVVSYFRSRPGEWHAGLRTFQRIVYADLWPGIDLAYYGAGGALKYEFVVQPGADPGQIRLAYRGAESAALNAAGQLAVTTPVGGFTDDVPVAWQDGPGGRTSIAATYDPQLTISRTGFASPGSDGTATGFGFRVGAYDPTRALVLDPVVLIYNGYIGGASGEIGDGIAVDGEGNVYVTGGTVSSQTTFPVRGGPDLTYNGDVDAFVAKVNPSGTALVYAGYIGGASLDAGRGITVDSAGSAYIVGYTDSDQVTSPKFPVRGGPDLSYNGEFDAFVAKVNPSGTELIYAGYIGGAKGEIGYGIAVDGTGSVYVSGWTNSDETTFPVRGGPDLTHNGGNEDAFIAKVNPAGTDLVYAGYIGGAGKDVGYDIAVNGISNAYVTGVTNSAEATFPVLGGPDPTHNGSDDAFVVKVNPAGTSLVYSGYIGGTGVDIGYGIAVDGAGNAYITGTTNSDEASFPVLGGPDLTFNGLLDVFVCKVNPTGAALVYAGYVGGAGNDGGYDITVDGAGNAYVTGDTNSDETTFPVLGGPDLTFNGTDDALVAKVNPSGTTLAYAGYIGGADSDSGNDIVVDRAGNAYVTGVTSSDETTFPVLGGPDLTFNGPQDAFVAKVGYHLPVVLWLPLIMR
jgi:hypothetical protein